MDNYDFMIAGGYTKRYHTEPTLLTDTVGHHSFNVACTIMALRPHASAELLRAALLHDVAEHRVGDMPANTKRALPNYDSRPIPGDGAATFREVFAHMEAQHMAEAGIDPPQLSAAEDFVLKLADVFDGMRFCIQERRMGNRGIIHVFRNFANYAMELLYGDNFTEKAELTEHALPCDRELRNHLMREWNYADR